MAINRVTLDVAASGTDTEVLDPGAGFRLEVIRLVLTCSVAGNIAIYFDAEADPATILYASATVGVPIVMDWSGRDRQAERPLGAAASVLAYTTGTGITGRLLVEYALVKA